MAFVTKEIIVCNNCEAEVSVLKSIVTLQELSSTPHNGVTGVVRFFESGKDAHFCKDCFLRRFGDLTILDLLGIKGGE